MDIRRYDDDDSGMARFGNFGRMPSMFDEMTRMLDSMGRFDGRMGLENGLSGFDTASDLIREDDRFVFVMDLPGFEREDIDLTFSDGSIHVAAVHDHEDESETHYGRQSRRVSEQIHVPGDVDVEGIEASYRNGVLEVHLPIMGEDGSGHSIDIQD